MCLMQCCKLSVYLVRLSNSGKDASDTKVALNTLDLSPSCKVVEKLFNCCNISIFLLYFEKLSCQIHIFLVTLNTLIAKILTVFQSWATFCTSWRIYQPNKLWSIILFCIFRFFFYCVEIFWTYNELGNFIFHCATLLTHRWQI